MNSDLPSNPCASFAEELSHLVLGELDEARRAAVEQHLAACAACRAERDLLAKSVALLLRDVGGIAPVLELSESRRAELMAQAAAAGGAAARRPWLTLNRLAAAAAVVMGATVAVNWTLRKMAASEPSPELAWRSAAHRSEFETEPLRDSDGFLISGTAEPEEPASAAGYAPGLAELGAPGDASTLTALPTEAAPSTDLDSSPAGTAPSPDPVALQEELKKQEAETEVRMLAIQPKAPAAGLPSGATGGTPLATGGGGGKRAHGGTDVPSFARDSKLAKETRPAGRSGGGSYQGPESTPAPKPVAPPAATEEALAQLQSLGYVGGDTGSASTAPQGFTARQQVGRYFYAVDENGDLVQTDAPVTIDGLALVLAKCNDPSQMLAVQPQLRAALAFDPNTPMDGGDAGRRTDDLVREFLKQLAPRQGETPRDMFFRYFGDHPFVSTRVDCQSTFGMDVDTASYNLVRAYLAQGNLPPKAAVRTEEFVNAFRHELAPPPADLAEVFAIHGELAPSPFGESGALLLRVGLKAREIPQEKRRPVALTFVIDVSGSMEEGGRLELVKRALRMLVNQLDERDSIGIVVFSTNGRRVLGPTNAARRSAIFAALDPLRPDGSTNADAGLRLGYDLALEQLRPDAENRVILCSDGVANTGITDANWLVQRIRECKTKDLYLNCIGVGMNNHNDALLEQLADEGDGFCAYVDRDEEAKEIFVDKLSGTLTTVARNAKIQLEFDPRAVRRFRQLGYENRALAHRDFRNDKVDAGEVGAGHEVIALYELELQPGAPHESFPLATVRCRYEEPRSKEVIEQARAIFVAEAEPTIQRASPRFRLAAAVAEFAEILRQSVHARSGSLADVERLAEPLVAELPGDPDVPEFVALVKQAARLPDLLPRRSDLVRCVDEIKRTRCLQEEMRSSSAAEDAANAELMRQLEEQNRRLEQALRDALERVAR